MTMSRTHRHIFGKRNTKHFILLLSYDVFTCTHYYYLIHISFIHFLSINLYYPYMHSIWVECWFVSTKCKQYTCNNITTAWIFIFICLKENSFINYYSIEDKSAGASSNKFSLTIQNQQHSDTMLVAGC